MKRGLQYLGSGALAVLFLFGAIAVSAHAQDGESIGAFADEENPVDFDEAFEPFSDELPIYDPQADEDAVDLSDFEPPRGHRIIEDLGTGSASFYGKRFHGRTTANGERFDMHDMTAAHRTLPFGSLVRVTNPRNGQQVVVRINDRGPFAKGRVIDLSRAAAEEIGMIRRGHARVQLELVE